MSRIARSCGIALLLAPCIPVRAAELVQLGAANWHLVPAGKEVDAIYGDFVLKNDRVVAVVAGVQPQRDATNFCWNTEGALIDVPLLAQAHDVPLPDERLVQWMQILNQGSRLWGVSNTDAHGMFHSSGTLRIYVRSSTDDPGRIDTTEVVRAARAGRMIMTSGPFVDVSFLPAPGPDGTMSAASWPGDEAAASEGTLRVRVECANWLDVDRVQVLVNGRADPALKFTRASHPQLFRDGNVRFKHDIPITVAEDAHLIVAAMSENPRPGPVPIMGNKNARPFAISNPVFLDVDGKGFEANGDTLGFPLVTTARPPGQ